MEKVKQDKRIWAAVAYILFFVPLLIESARKDVFVKYHVRQGLGLFIAFFLVRLATIMLLAMLFFFAGFLSLVLTPIINIFLLVILVVGIVNASRGEKRPLPVIGVWADKFLKI